MSYILGSITYYSAVKNITSPGLHALYVYLKSCALDILYTVSASVCVRDLTNMWCAGRRKE